MKPLRIFHNASFRFALLYAAVFSLSVSLLGILMFVSIRHSLESQLRSHILSETEHLMGEYKEDGLEELRHDVRERTDASRVHRLFYALRGPGGKVLFDDIAPTAASGWRTLTTRQGYEIMVHTTLLEDGYSLHIGADLAEVSAMERALRNSIVAALAFTLLLGVIGGIIVSRRFLARVDRLTQATEHIGRGSLSARLPVSSARDDFDQLAITINHMLERIETLMHEVKHASTSIAHDMRTPLGKLRHKLEALSVMPQEPPARDALQESIALLDETLLTFASLLSIAEIESGSISSQPVPIDLPALFAHLDETYGIIAEENGQRFTARCDATAPLTGDTSLIVQMLVNLIENAIRYAGKGADITLTAHSTAGHIVLTLADTGHGIPREEFANIAKPFYRLDHSRNTRGTGLGLSLVNAIATLHGARMQLRDNAPGLAVDIYFTRR